jgi:outer membrane protein
MTQLPIRIAFVLFIVCMAAPARAQSAQALSLQQAQQLALANHPQIQQAEFTSQADDEAVRAARSAYYPTAFASLTGADASAGSRIAAGGLNNPIILERFAGGVGVSQLVTDFGRTGALVDSMSLRADTGRRDVDARRADVLLQVDRSYFMALRAQAVERVAEETTTTRQLVVDQVTAQTASGLKSDLDLSLAKVNLSEAQMLLLQAKSDVDTAFAALTAALGRADAASYTLADEPLPSAPPPDPEALVTEALRDRPDVAAVQLSAEAARRFADAEGALRLPAVSMVAAVGTVPYHVAGLTDKYSAAGINLTVPITTGGLIGARHAAATLAAQSETQRLRDLQDRVARDVRTAWHDAETAFQQMDAATQLLAAASDAADLAQTRFDIGLGSIVELTQAQLSKTRAQIAVATARYDYQLRTAVLKYQTGQLK